LRKVATDFWFAIQRMTRREGPSTTPDEGPSGFDDDDGAAGSRVPRKPPDSSGSASVELVLAKDLDDSAGDTPAR
jgi:hypothetical protein